MRSSETLSKPASRSVPTAPRTCVRARAALEHVEQVRLEALRAERDAVDPVLAQQRGQLGRDRLGVGLDRRLRRVGKPVEQARERVGLGEGRRAAAEEDGLDLVREQTALELELRQQRVDVVAVLAVVARHGDEVAVAAAVGAEGQVDVEVARARSSPRDGGRKTPFWNGTRQLVTRGCRRRAGCVPVRHGHSLAPLVQVEHGQERLLRHLDAADLLHPLLALLLLLEQLALAA